MSKKIAFLFLITCYWATIFAQADIPNTTELSTVSNGSSRSIPFPDFPAYPEGTVSDIYNAGPGLSIDKDAETTEDSKMVVISVTTAGTFTNYVETLLKSGFTQVSKNTIEDNLFYTLANKGQLYYVYFTGGAKQVRIVQDNSTRTPLADLDAQIQGTGKTAFYLYSIDYTHGEGQTSRSDYWKIDCGTLLIIKLKDNSLFIIDSGHKRQGSNAALEGLLRFLYEITGQESGTILNIRGWFISHAHGDHVYAIYPFLTKYHDVLNVESVLFNIPSYQTMKSGYDSGTFLMKEAFNTYYPDCKYVQLHTGQHFTLQGVEFEVLFTHEDAVSATGVTTIGNFNDTSTILKMWMDGKSFMLLGDAYSQAQTYLLDMYTTATLSSDCVQTAHHGYNNLSALYKAIKAPLAFFCNSPENVSTNPKVLAGVVEATDNVKVLYADPNTVKITIEDGNLVTEDIPSYRSYFTTVTLPNLNADTTVGGNKVDLNTVLAQPSLISQVIDKSITGTDSKSVSESCSLILDGTTSTKYCTDKIPATIAWTMKKPVLLKWYVVYTANDNASNPGRNPHKWILCGSNDAATWEPIDYVKTANLPDKNYVGTAFAISNPVPYQYYAFKMFSTGGAAILQISEIGLYGEDNTASNNFTSSADDLPIVVTVTGHNSISINYTGIIDADTQLSIYNTSGQLQVIQRLSSSKTSHTLPGGDVYIVTVANKKGSAVQKIKLD